MEGNNPKVIENAEGMRNFHQMFLINILFYRSKNHTLNCRFHWWRSKTSRCPSQETSCY